MIACARLGKCGLRPKRDRCEAMKRQRHDFVLGLAAMLFVALFIVTFFFLNPFQRSDTKRIVVQFRHADGVAPIKPGSPVLLSGALDVGQVTGLHARTITVTLPDGRETTELMLVAEADINTDIDLYGDCQITTDQPAVGGAGFLVILDVGTPGTPLEAGKPIDGSKAFRIGLFDRLFTQAGLEEQVHKFVLAIIEGKVKKKRYPGSKKKGLPGLMDQKRLFHPLIFSQSKKSVMKLTKGFYPAPLQAIEVIAQNLYCDRDRGLSTSLFDQ